MRASRIGLSLAIVISAMVTVFAQTPGAKPGKASTKTSATSTAPKSGSTTSASAEAHVQQSLQEILEEPSSSESYHYDPQGRRDPFQSLVGPTPTLKDKDRPAGMPGFLIDEIKLQGVVRTRGQGLIALVNGPDKGRGQSPRR